MVVSFGWLCSPEKVVVAIKKKVESGLKRGKEDLGELSSTRAPRNELQGNNLFLMKLRTASCLILL